MGRTLLFAFSYRISRRIIVSGKIDPISFCIYYMSYAIYTKYSTPPTLRCFDHRRAVLCRGCTTRGHVGDRLDIHSHVSQGRGEGSIISALTAAHKVSCLVLARMQVFLVAVPNSISVSVGTQCGGYLYQPPCHNVRESAKR